MNTSEERYLYNGTSFDFLRVYSESDKTSDLSAVISSLYRYKNIDDNEIRRMIKYTGKLSSDNIERYVSVYKKTMEDLIQLFSTDSQMKEYIGL